MSQEMIGPGYSATILGRAGLRYREGDKTLFVDGEMLVGAYDFAIYPGSIQRWENSGEPISEADKQRIVANIEALFRQNKLSLQVGC